MAGAIYGGGSISFGDPHSYANEVTIKGSISSMKSINITANLVTIVANSIISVTGSSPQDGPGKGFHSSDGQSGGGSYGGSGGSHVTGNVGNPYGSYTLPTLYGSRGGHSSYESMNFLLFIQP